MYKPCSCSCVLVPVRTFCMALEGFGAQMGDTVTLEVLCAGEGFPTTLLCADKATIIIMFPDKRRRRLCQVTPFSHTDSPYIIQTT